MKKIFLLTLLTSLAFASVRVDTTYAGLGEVAKKIGGDNVSVSVLGSSKYDPHFIVPKPSLLSKLRRADLLIINGAGLELGWLPPLIRSANNAKIQPGAKGFLDISHSISMIDVPDSVSRAFGDVHAEGNPHYITDPHNIVPIAKAIEQKLSSIDEDNSQIYKKNLENFIDKWNSYLKIFDNKMLTCKDRKVIQYHELFNYFLKRYGFKSYANIEPLPGISPSSKHTLSIINTIRDKDIKIILQDVYHEKKTAKFIASKTDAKVEVTPHDVGAVKATESLEDFYNSIAEKICH
jgi:zinc/manganese transport system substrate-binding protein